MAVLILHIVLILLLGIAFYQDWKFRAISWMLFPGLLVVAVMLFIFSGMNYETVAFNIVFLAVVTGTLFLYVSAKRGGWTNIFKSDLGWGDVLFLMAVCPLFSQQNYILFFISGMFLSGLLHFLLFMRKKEAKIPLAGYLAVYLILLQVGNFFTEVDMFYNDLIG